MSAAQVIPPSPLVLPPDSALRRTPPRPAKDRQRGYAEEFDDRTVWYDAFRHGDDVVLSGPPLRNLRSPLLDHPIRVDGGPLQPGQVELADIDRTQRSLLHAVSGERLTVFGGDLPELSAEIGADDRAIFAGRRVILTKTAGGAHTRLDEWLTFHQRAHGIDAALVYVTDDAAVSRCQDQLSAAGLQAAVIVPWLFKDGPGAGETGAWDSDFSHYSALEHARLRFLQSAAAVLNLAVDQLVVTDDRHSIFDLAEAAPRHLIRFWQLRIESGTVGQQSSRPRGFHDFGHHRAMTAPPRWAMVLDPTTSGAQWKVHTVRGIHAPVSARVAGREFVALADRPEEVRTLLPGVDRTDREMLEALEAFLPAPLRSPPGGDGAGAPDARASINPAGRRARLRGRLGAARRALSRRAPNPLTPDRADRRDDYGYLFIMTYGRSGSTLVQGILSSIPGYLIRGENNAMMRSLYEYHRTAIRERRRLNRPERLPATHPFYGIDEYPDEIAFRDMRRLALDTILRPEPDTRVVGFKEIEWTEGDLVDFVRFMRDVFPGARFVVNTRDHAEVVRSKWWMNRPDAAEQIKAAEDKIMEAAEALGDAAYHIHYNDYVQDPKHLRGLYAWLGEPFDLHAARRAMERRYSY